ncbi:MAG: glycosyl transferase [Pirellulaceae bacterium]|nr:MAG: glycosyl transferase [Pirellulaceae bacterium]
MIRLLQIFNQYRTLFNGEENVVHRTAELVRRHGGVCRVLMKSSRSLRGPAGRFKAFVSAFYNIRAAREVEKVVAEFQPDIVHAHNVFPLFSPSVLVACHRLGLPVVYTAHNQSLTCPRADHLRRGKLCDLCLGGKEYFCVIYNCRDNICESIAYAARSAFARKARFFCDRVHVIIALTSFARERLVVHGFSPAQVCVLPNMVSVADRPADAGQGQFVLFAGRLSPEKGLDLLVEAARRLRHIPFFIAGDGPLRENLAGRCPENVELLGQVTSERLRDLYRASRMVVLPSLTYEMCPLVIGEAMGQGLPVVASRIGGLPELVRHQETGALFEPGNVAELARWIETLWDRPDLCRRWGEAGWQKAREQYSEEVYWQKLLDIYRLAARRAGRRWRIADSVPPTPAAAGI